MYYLKLTSQTTFNTCLLLVKTHLQSLNKPLVKVKNKQTKEPTRTRHLTEAPTVPAAPAAEFTL